MYKNLKKIKKFTTKENVNIILGKPKLKFGNLPVYYYGNGVLVAYASYCFNLEGDKRVEYGKEGEYAVSIYHYADVEMLKLDCGINSVDINDIKRNDDEVIDGDITYNMTFEDVQKMNLKDQYTNNYMEGETRKLIDGKVKVTNLFIMYGTHTLYFRGKSKKSMISGFKYALNE